MGLFDFFSGKNKPQPPVNSNQDLLEKVEPVPGLKLSRALASYWPEIEKTKLPYISIDATPKEDLALEQSKFGHFPCMPIDFEYPTDIAGRPMYPLAQINCKELPALSGYPTSGYLQFYISGFDDVYGIDFNDSQSQKNFRVLYFEENDVEKYKADFSFLDEVMESEQLPIPKPYALSFEKKEEYIGAGDVREAGMFDFAKRFPAMEDELQEEVYDNFRSTGHKIGGYAYFTQEDPRLYNSPFKDYILLLQIDSLDEIMWGDCGVANFFIHPDDLARKDFSKVVYNWDCS